MTSELRELVAQPIEGPRSITTTSRPSCASRPPPARPTAPAPTTPASAVSLIEERSEAAPAVHGAPDALLGEAHPGRPRGRPGASRGVENLSGVGPNFFLDDRERRRLCAAVILHGAANNASGIGNEIGPGQRVAGVQAGLGLGRRRDVGALDDELGLEPLDIVLAQDVGLRRR